MEEKKRMGALGVMNSSGQNISEKSEKVEIKKHPYNFPDTIYNLIFKKFDEEKVNEKCNSGHKI